MGKGQKPAQRTILAPSVRRRVRHRLAEPVSANNVTRAYSILVAKPATEHDLRERRETGKEKCTSLSPIALLSF